MQLVLMLWYCLYCAQRLQMLCWKLRSIQYMLPLVVCCSVLLYHNLSTYSTVNTSPYEYVRGHYSGFTLCGMPAKLFFSFDQFPEGFVSFVLFSSTGHYNKHVGSQMPQPSSEFTVYLHGLKISILITTLFNKNAKQINTRVKSHFTLCLLCCCAT